MGRGAREGQGAVPSWGMEIMLRGFIVETTCKFIGLIVGIYIMKFIIRVDH